MGGEENSVSLAGMLLHHFLQRIGGLRIQMCIRDRAEAAVQE